MVKKTLKLYPYSDDFSRLFEIERLRLKEVLGSMLDIEHVGSTSVLGLGGKGIIDIMVGVKSSSEIYSTVNKLVAAGYFADLDNPLPKDRYFLASREHDSTIGDYHLHVVVKNGDEWNRLLCFRDKLRGSRKLRDDYMKLKEKLFAETDADREKYKKLKNNFIQRVLEEGNL